MATPSLSSLLHHYGEGFSIPPHDHREYTYVASGAADSDDIATIIFKRGGSSGTTVATLTFTYVGSTNNVLTATLSVP